MARHPTQGNMGGSDYRDDDSGVARAVDGPGAGLEAAVEELVEGGVLPEGQEELRGVQAVGLDERGDVPAGGQAMPAGGCFPAGGESDCLRVYSRRGKSECKRGSPNT